MSISYNKNTYKNVYMCKIILSSFSKAWHKSETAVQVMQPLCHFVVLLGWPTAWCVL